MTQPFLHSLYLNDPPKMVHRSTKIATVFGRNNFDEYIKREIRNGNLVRIKKKAPFAVNGTAPIAGGYVNDASNNIQQTEKYVNIDNELHSDRNKDSIDNRTLLANALETTAQNDLNDPPKMVHRSTLGCFPKFV